MPFRAVATTVAPLCSRLDYFLSPSQQQCHLHFPAGFSSSLLSTQALHFSTCKRRRFDFAVEALDSSSPPSATSSVDKAIVSDDQFSIAKINLGAVALGSGLTLLSYGFGAYFNILPGSEWSAIMLTYGFPVAVIGMALKAQPQNSVFAKLETLTENIETANRDLSFKYAELKPVPCLTYSDAQLLREKCATPVLKQVKTDVTRYRYGDEQHLDEALKRIFQYGQGGGISRRSAPVLQMIREEVTEDGKYCFVLVFEAKTLQLSDFEQRKAKFASFFGPGITAEVGKGVDNLYEVRLISNTPA